MAVADVGITTEGSIPKAINIGLEKMAPPRPSIPPKNPVATERIGYRIILRCVHCNSPGLFNKLHLRLIS